LGGSASASTTVTVTTGTTYTTNFDLTENPISEGGRWFHLDPTLTKVKTTGGVALGTMTGSGFFDDSNAYLTGFGNDHTIEGTVFLRPGTSGSPNREIELLLRWTDNNPSRPTTFGPTSVIGYEINVAHNGGYLILGRFKGAELTRAVNPPLPKNNDKFKAVIQGQTITIFWNGAPLLLTSGGTSFTDNDPILKITTGNPGIGFYIDSGASPDDFGFTSLTVTSP